MKTTVIGRWAVCNRGRIGLIERLGNRSYLGVGIDGRPWSSKRPVLLGSQESNIFTELLEASKRSVIRRLDRMVNHG